MFRVVAVILAIILSTFSFSFGQTKPKPKDDEVIRVDTELIDVPLSVSDKTGRPLINLTKNNFTIYEDGKLQNVEEFSAVSAPFEVALLLDTSGSTRADLELIRRAASDFIASLRPGDRVAIIAFRSTTVEDRAASIPDVVIELTSDRNALRSAVDRVGTGNGTPYYDSLDQVASKVFRDPPKDEFRGRRALVALTDGVDSTSATSFSDVKARLTEKGLSAYFININTREFFEERLLGDCYGAMRFSQAQIKRYYASFSKDSKVEKTADFCKLGDFERLAISKALYDLAESEMSELAKVSGGRVLPAADLMEARSAFKQIASDIGTRYSLGYYSTNEKRDGKYRAIRVELKGLPAGTALRAREGYTAPAN